MALKQHVQNKHAEKLDRKVINEPKTPSKSNSTKDAKEPKEQGPKDGFCQHCGQYFKMLKQHIKYKHESNKPWKCHQCDYSHALRSGLKAHIRYSHPVEKDMKVCHICGFTSASASIVKI